MHTVEITFSAETDLLEIRQDLESKSVQASAHYGGLFQDAFRLLSRFPHAGRDRPDLEPPGLRSLPVLPYLIFYRVRDTNVEIVRVVHGARNLPNVV